MSIIYKKAAFAVMLVCLYTGLLFSQEKSKGINFDPLTFDNAVVKAKNESKLIFIDCYADWCGPCKVLDRDYFTNEKVGDFYNQNFVNLKMNMEKEEGLKLLKRYPVGSYPTMLFINPHSLDVVYKLVGVGGDIEWLINGGKSAIHPNQNLASLKEFYNNNSSDVAAVKAYMTGLATSHFNKEKDEVLSSYLSNVPKESLYNNDNWDIINSFVNSTHNSNFIFLLDNADGYKGVVDKAVVDKKIDDLFRTTTLSYIHRKRVPDDQFAQESFNRHKSLLEKYGSTNAAYYLAQLRMIDMVQHDNYLGMLSEMDKSLKSESVVDNSNKMYFIWLNLAYLFNCGDEEAIDEGLKWVEHIKPTDERGMDNWLSLKKRLTDAKDNNDSIGATDGVAASIMELLNK